MRRRYSSQVRRSRYGALRRSYREGTNAQQVTLHLATHPTSTPEDLEVWLPAAEDASSQLIQRAAAWVRGLFDAWSRMNRTSDTALLVQTYIDNQVCD